MADSTPAPHYLPLDTVGVWSCPHCRQEFLVTLRQARVHLRYCDEADIDYPPLTPSGDDPQVDGADRG